MAGTMADRVAAGRRLRFVGRSAELELFDSLVQAPSGQGAVVFVHGPAGVGKTTLLRRFAASCDEAGVTSVLVDARDLPPMADALEQRLSAPLAQRADSTRLVVLLDGYELLAELDDAVRERVAPQLPEDSVLVLAGQRPPSTGWRTDPGWAPLLHVLRLGNLSTPEAGSFLTASGVPPDLHEPAIAFTHGHPLALALVGEVVRQKGSLPPGATADVVRELLDRLLAVVPSQTHRAALEAAAQVRVLDEPLLAALLDVPDAAELFAWLRGLPFVDAGAEGVHLHDLTRDALASDLEWRHPLRHSELHDRARTYFLGRLDGADLATQATALLDLMYLHPFLRAFVVPDDAAHLRVDGLRPGQDSAVADMVARHEGEESAAQARHWLARQPAAWRVILDAAGEVLGAVCLLALEAVAPDQRDVDPAVAAAYTELEGHPPLRPKETATLVRHWLSRNDYQSVSPVQNLIAAQLAQHYLTTAGLAVTLLPFANPQEWAELCAYSDHRRAPRADFTVGGRTYGVFVHDWRTVPPATWVANLSRQETGATPPAEAPTETDGVRVLSETDFRAAVRQALRDHSRPDRLRANPLLDTRLVASRAASVTSAADRVKLLQGLVQDAADTLKAVPADHRLHRVLVRAYLSPAPSLERAAEILDLPSSTFRRLLGTATTRVATLLWQQELEP